MAVVHDKYSRMYSMFHLDHETEAAYLQIHVGNNKAPLEISREDHLFLFANGKAVVGARVKVGDSLICRGNLKVTVQSIKTVKRKGMYSPGTLAGDIMVNGVLASNCIDFGIYTCVHPNAFVHWMMAPFRLCYYAGLCVNETYDDTRRSHYIVPFRTWG